MYSRGHRGTVARKARVEPAAQAVRRRESVHLPAIGQRQPLEGAATYVRRSQMLGALEVNLDE